MYFVYILYSASRDKYYVGSCEDVNKRLINWFRASRFYIGRVTGSNPVTPTILKGLYISISCCTVPRHKWNTWYSWYTFHPKNARNNPKKAVFTLILRWFLTEKRLF